ncbi:MAG: nucleotidyltransferase family protein [Clostridia bacterium]|nr:nucleotidyltransferase family protein [Clostridia bacterium]
MDGTSRLFFNLLGQAVGDEICKAAEELSEQTLRELFLLSKKHDLAHLIGFSLEKAGALPEGKAKEHFSKEQMLALYRYRRMEYEYGRICALFEAEGIDYMPLKGAVLRALYPEPWMRTSCDIDLLIKEEQTDSAIALLKSKLNCKSDGQKTFHDVHVHTESGVHLELHYNIKEELDPMDGVLLRVWDYALPEEGHPHRHLQSPEYLVFHQIAHAAYHFIKGGCGVRPLLDLWLLKKKTTFDEKKLAALLKEAGLSLFAKNLFLLTEVWFEGREHCPLTLEMEEYVLGAGVYGTVENAVAMGQEGENGKTHYLLSQIFMPYKKLKERYSVLKKHPLLFPFFTVYRWFKILFSKKELALKTVQSNGKLSKDRIKRVNTLKKELGL